jgi:hypothetical protein
MENIKRYFSNIIITSNNYKECVKKLGLTSTGNNNDTVKKYIKLYNIDVSHFIHENNSTTKINLCDILIENSSYSRASLKDRLYKEGLKNVNVNYVVKVKNGWVKKCR